MELSDQVCALEYSKRLDELKVPQNSSFYWCTGKLICPALLHENIRINTIWINKDFFFSAFTSAELGEMLPNNFRTHKEGSGWIVVDSHCLRCDGKDSFWIDENEANARAKMLIYLIENQLVKV